MKSRINSVIMQLFMTAGLLLLGWTLFIFFYQYIAALGLSNAVIQAFGNARVLSALSLSISSAFVTAGIAFALGVPLAYIFATKKFRCKSLIASLTIDIPQTFPPIGEGIIFMLMLGPSSPFHVNLAYTFTALVLTKLFIAAPFVIALTTRKFVEIHEGGLDTIARSLGANQLQVFSTVYFPLALKDIIGGVALCWARAMGELGGSLIFAGVIPFKTEIIPTLISTTGSSDLATSLAATILVTTASIVALLFFKFITPGGTLWKGLFYKI